MTNLMQLRTNYAYKNFFRHTVGRCLTFFGENVWIFDIFVVELEKKIRVKKGNLPDFHNFLLASLPVNFVTRRVKAPANSPCL